MHASDARKAHKRPEGKISKDFGSELDSKAAQVPGLEGFLEQVGKITDDFKKSEKEIEVNLEKLGQELVYFREVVANRNQEVSCLKDLIFYFISIFLKQF